MSERALPPESIKTMAENIAFVSFDVIQFRDNEMRSHWYRYREIDLYYFQTLNGDLAKLHISIFGQVIEWNQLDGIRTGLLIEEESEAGVSEIVQYDARTNRASVEQALEVLRHAVKIEAPQRAKLIACLNTGSAGVSHGWRAFLKRFFRRESR